MSFDDLMYLIDPFRRLADIFRDLRRLADEAPCSAPPIEYARAKDNGKVIADLFRGISARYRAKMYRLRFSPCCHKAGGVMIRKKGRLVRRKR
ncbi:MAG: hypothetical protein PUH30_09465 [Oscillospiraceae bacterium]|nr:hypothetical protein [Oscillospiraceae bacterium]MDD7279740.1 hypothetical protein [Oscillospiraceae bacterium]